MGDGVVSDRTVELIQSLRAQGILFVIITGARKSTLLERLPFLPKGDAAVSETGSRVYLDPSSPFERSLSERSPDRGAGADAKGIGGTAGIAGTGGLVLDEAWRAKLEPICGDLEREMPPSERPEPLWAFHNLLIAEGFRCDSRSYYGCFRVDVKGDAAEEERLRRILDERLPETLDWAINLSKFDIFPRISGKANAVAYLQARYQLRPEECACLFDDDNDLGMAERCGVHLLPGLTSDSVRRAAAEHPEWRVATRAGEGVFAIEELLETLLAEVIEQRAGADSTER